MKRIAVFLLLAFFIPAANADYNADLADAEKNFSAGNYLEALQLYKSAYAQKQDEKVRMSIEFIETKLKNNPELAKKKEMAAESGDSIKNSGTDANRQQEDGAIKTGSLFSGNADYVNSSSFVYRIRYEVVLGGHNGIGAVFESGCYRFFGEYWDTIGGGFEYRFYPFGKAPDSLFAGAGAYILNLRLNKYFIFLNVNLASVAAVRTGVFTGYRWIFNSGFMLEANAGIGYMSYGNVPYESSIFKYGGLICDFGFGMGYAW